jgi:Domain of unknown function (DUF4192)
MNAPAPVLARLHAPRDLIAALPYLLGFHPRDSLVVITLVPGAPPSVGLVLRADLPPPGHERELVEQLCAPIRARGDGAVLIVVVGGPACVPAAVALLRAALDELGVVVARAVWAASTTAGAPWSCLDDPGDAGLLPDPSATPLAAATAISGTVTFSGRDELQRLVEPDPAAVLQRRAALLDAAVEGALPDAVDSGYDLVRDAVARAAGGWLPDDDESVVRLAVALSEQLVRDRCLSLCVGATARAAERLWLALTRATPPPEVADAAALAALSAYLRGDGTLAGMALDRALRAWPGHNLSTLLDAALRTALPPQRLEQFIADTVADVELTIADDAGGSDVAPG